MNSAVRHDYTWQAQFLSRIREIIGPLILAEAPFDIDVKQATDLIVLNLRQAQGRPIENIGCRVRRPDMQQFAHQFTLRYSRPTGAKTEYEKIKEGWCEWLFYAIALGYGFEFYCWTIIDLGAFRYHLATPSSREQIRPLTETKTNRDGTKFLCLPIDGFPANPSIIVARQLPLVLPKQEPIAINPPHHPVITQQPSLLAHAALLSESEINDRIELGRGKV
jgi:hypothetical protein